MKFLIGFVLGIIIVFTSNTYFIGNNAIEDFENIEKMESNWNEGDYYELISLEGEILEVYSTGFLMKLTKDSTLSKDTEVFVHSDVENLNFSLNVGDIVNVKYDGQVKETYPIQILGSIVFLIDSNAKCYIEEDGRIKYNGIWYDKAKLSKETLDCLDKSYQGKMLSSYAPFEFMIDGAVFGLNITVENISNDGLTFVFNHDSSKELTDVYNLNTGDFYSLEVLENNVYVPIKTIIEEFAWNSMAYIIKENDKTEMEINWKWLYGSLEKGQYRLGKEVMNFKETGEYDTIMVYGYFELN